MRVLMVSNTYLPVRNGVTMSMAGWIAGLRELGHNVDVWTCATQDPELEGVYASRGIRSTVDGFPYPLSLKAPHDVEGRDYDVVHTHHPVMLGPAAARFARDRGAVLTATAHSDYLGYIDDYAPRAMRGALTARGAKMMRGFFGGCDLVFAPSSAIARSLRGWGVDTLVEPCTYPVELDKFSPLTKGQARAALGIAPTAPLALYAGRIAAEKNIDTLFAEFEAARDLAPGAQLAIAGDGPRRSRLARFAIELGLGDHIRFLGSLAPQELGRWYAAADVHVSASPAEVGPLTVVEAAACGTASVGYRVSGFEDRIVDGETGLLADTEGGALAKALGQLLANRAAAARMGEVARTAAEANRPAKAAQGLVEGYTRAGA